MAKIIFFLDFKDKSKKRKETGVDGNFFMIPHFYYFMKKIINYFYY